MTHSYPMASFKSLALSVAAVAVFSGLSHAAISITFDQVGGDVVATYSGSVDLDSMDSTSDLGVVESRGYDGDAAYFRNNAAATVTVGFTNFIASPSFVNASGGAPQTTLTFSGDDFGLVSTGTFEQVFLPNGYVSGTTISGSLTFESTTIATLGLNPGTHVWQWTGTAPSSPVESATITVIPEPSAFGLAALGLVSVACRRRRRQAA